MSPCCLGGMQLLSRAPGLRSRKKCPNSTSRHPKRTSSMTRKNGALSVPKTLRFCGNAETLRCVFHAPRNAAILFRDFWRSVWETCSKTCDFRSFALCDLRMQRFFGDCGFVGTLRPGITKGPSGGIAKKRSLWVFAQTAQNVSVCAGHAGRKICTKALETRKA